MKILITGGYGFIGSFIAERFFKENHSVFIIDNLSSGKKSNVTFKHRSLVCDIADEQCASFFKAHSFDVVIHCAAQTHVQHSINEPVQDSVTNILGLINMLNLSKKYGVKKFVFSSSAAVYGPAMSLPLSEEEPANPVSPYGINKMTGEIYCRKWEELYGLSSLIFRFSNVYGPKQHLSKESGVIALFTSRLLENRSLLVHGDGNQTRDFIYAGDVAEAVYRGVVSDVSGVYNLSSNTETSLNELVEAFSAFHSVKPVQYAEERAGDIRHSRLDNSLVKAELDWVPKYTLHEGLEKVTAYYQQNPAAAEQPQATKRPSLPYGFLPFIENLVLFLFFLLFTAFLTPAVDTVDLWLIYILLAALLFGKTQSILASVLSIGLHIYEASVLGRAWTSLFVDNSILATFTIYLLVGLIVSYVVDRRKIELQFTRDELESAQSKYAFLSSVYEETLDIKNHLQEQILRTEDGIGHIYQATRALDSLEPEALLTGAIQVLERTLKTDSFVIYTTAPNGYARLAAKSGSSSFLPSPSLKLVEGSLAEKAVSTKKIAYNASLQPGEPLFASPIVQGNETVAVIVCYNAQFDQLTLSYRNLVDVVSRLISASLARAYDYINEINTERYVGETTALKPYYFERILAQKQKAMAELHIPFTMLKVLPDKLSSAQLHDIGTTLRTTDYFGFNEEKELFILLSNTQPADARLVVERLQHKHISTLLIEEGIQHAG